MSIISSFKKALGFPNEFDDDDLDALEFDDDNNIPTPKRNEKSIKPQQPANSAPIAVTPVAEPIKTIQPINTELPGEVFDAIIELFNATQPEFVSQCLSVEKQRAYILERIDNSLREKLVTETENARRRGEQQWETERQKLNDDLEKLRSEYHFMKQQREEFQSAQLSATRQKRAMTDRIHDLEHQISSLQSDREQLQLENRSMINKLRVVAVRNASDDADTEAQNQRLAQENVDLTDKVLHYEKSAKKLADECEQLRNENATLKKDNTSKSEEITRLESELDKFGIDTDVREALSKAEARIQAVEIDCNKKEQRIAELTAENYKLYEDIKVAGTKILNAEKATLFAQEESKVAKAELSSSQKEAASQIEELNNEIKRLREMINSKDAISKPTEPTTKTKKRGKQSETKSAAESKPVKETPKQAVKISAIDELMDSTDWFIAPEPVPLKKDPEVEEDFGYKEPPARKASRDEDKQLSLW